MQGQLGDVELDRFQEELALPPSLSVRTNPCKPITFDKYEPVPWCSCGFYLKERPSFTLDPLFHAGTYYVQEASSMFLEQAVVHSVDLATPLKVLDLCAAPGGKSTHLLSLINPQSLLVSNEVIRSRANILSENIQKWGCTNAVVTQNDPSDFSHLNGFFDLILVDAPCSGEGLFRKNPESLSQWSPANVELCSQRQKRIMSDVFPALKQNGILIYSTCTYNEKENEENLTWLAEQQNIEFLSIPISPDWGIEEVHQGKIKGYRFFPHRLRGEGFFISIIRKSALEPAGKMKNKELPRSNKGTEEKLKPWIKVAEDYMFLVNNENISLIHKDQNQAIDFLSKQLHVIQMGTAIGSMKHEKLIPDHALALSNVLNPESVLMVELSKEEALNYLRKEAVHLPGLKTGHALITYSGICLGWVNILANRVNSLYPTNWRIRMK